MLSLPQVHGDSSSVTTFTNLVDVFNPLVNTYELPANFTIRDYKWFLSQLYTRENIATFPVLVGGTWCHDANLALDPSRRDAVLNFIAEIPDDKLWTLAFGYITEQYNGEWTMIYYEWYNDHHRTSSVGPTYSPCVDDRSMSARSITLLAEKYLTRTARLVTALEANLDKDVLTSHFPRGLNEFLFIFQNFLFGYRYVSSNENYYDFTHNRSEIKALLERPDASTSFKLEMHPNAFYVNLREILSDSNRRPLYRLLNYSASPTKYLAWPRMHKREVTPVLYGVELEVATNLSIQEMIDAQKNLFFIAKSDGSITGRGSTKAELVTVPMSLRQHKTDWAHWFKKLRYEDFDCTVDTNNGMHVHIDKTAFLNPAHIRAFTWFFVNPCNHPFTLAMSERTPTSFENFSPTPRFSSNASLLRCFKQCVEHAERIRGAVNLRSNKPTIEVRLFRGLVSYASILKNLEFVDAVFHFTQDRSFAHLTLTEFFTWLDSLPSNRYKVLRKYFSIMPKREEMITVSYFTQLTYNMDDPQAVCTRLNNSGIPLSSQVASILNRSKKRTYVFNKKTGLLEVDQSRKSKVAFLDRVLEAKYTRNVA